MRVAVKAVMWGETREQKPINNRLIFVSPVANASPFGVLKATAKEKISLYNTIFERETSEMISTIAS